METPVSKLAWIALLLLLVSRPAAAAAERTTGTHAGKPYMEATDYRTVAATVIAIDKTTRVVKLRTESGDTVVVVAGKEVKNFTSIKVSDRVKVAIVEQLRVEVTSGAAARDTQEVSSTSSEPGEQPSGTLTRTSRSTASIVAIDKTAGTVTLKGQDGNTYTVKPKLKENLDKIQVGDQVIFTTTKRVAASVAQAPAQN
jgi:ribosomal protein S4E